MPTDLFHEFLDFDRLAFFPRAQLLHLFVERDIRRHILLQRSNSLGELL